MQQKDLKNPTWVDTSSFAKKTELADVDKLDIGKFKNVPSDLSNLRCIVDKLNVDKFVPVPVDASKASDAVHLMLLKRLNIMNKFKKLIILVLLKLVIQLKKTGSKTNLNEIKNKINDHDHAKYITTQEFNTLAADNIMQD